MDINRESLIKLLEAIADASEMLQRELILYQLLFTAACEAKGLTEDEIQKAVARARIDNAENIDTVSQQTHRSLLANLLQALDLLASDEDAAVRFLEEWDSRALPN